MTQNDDRRAVPVSSDPDATQPGTTPTSGGDRELTNVDLQFMGRPSAREQIDAAVEAESHEAGDYRERGMDKQDVAVALTMDGSDPPSTNMGDADRE